MTINLTDPANHPANGLLAVERIIRVREELQRTLWHKNGSAIDYVTADAIKGLEELLVSREAVPVAWQIHTPKTAVTYVETNQKSVDNIRNGFGIEVEITPLYTSLPGPQSSKMSGIMPDYEGVAMTQRECYMAGKEAGLAEAGKSPVIPDGYTLVPFEPTEDMIINGFESEPTEDFSDEDVWAEYEKMSGCQKAAHRARLCWNAMLAAAPKLEKI